MMYIPRYLERTILRLHRSFKILYLGGPRQVGKTTILKHLAEKLIMNYVTLDELGERKLAKHDPELFLQRHPSPLFIDEVQYAPELFSALKIRVDQSDRKGRYWLSGSQHFSMMKNVRESLAGRIGIMNLLGFSEHESLKLPALRFPFYPKPQRSKKPFGVRLSVPEVFSKIHRGWFPSLFSRSAPPLEAFYNSYLQTYLDRDVRDHFQIEKISEFQDFLRLCAARTGQILNISDLARDAGVSVHAANTWIRILESSLQIYLLRPFSRNVSKRFIKAPKLYFLDTGLAAFLTLWKSPETLAAGNMAGAFFETFVIAEIVKSYLHRGELPPLYYFRDKEKHEVDLIIERNGMFSPIEIKMTANPTMADTRGIQYFQEKFPSVGKGTLICLRQTPLTLNDRLEALPVGNIQ